jgi:SAM-dependent methyltransferase
MSNRLAMTVAWTPEFREAPEFERLQARVRVEAGQVWNEVELFEGLPTDSVADHLLIVGERCLLGRRSMAVMRQSIEAGAPAAVPRRLAESGLRGLEQVRTLRAIEQAEEQYLSATDSGQSAPFPPHPAMLLSPDAATALEARKVAAILAGEDASVVPVTSGLCHEFIDYYGEVREDILPFLDADCRDVLEIGCGRGATGAFLQRSHGCRVTGVELNPVVASAAADRLHRVVVGDALEVDPGGPFDAVVACELFEHLVDSEAFLSRLQNWLRPGGRAVLSVPNVGHWAIVEDLLAGRWDYLPIGLLCSTHYRFFTRRTLENTLHAAGLTDFDIIAQRSEEPGWLDELPAGLEVDTESLSTTGYYVVIRAPKAR